MRIATWNINGLRARLDYVFHWLDSRRPDLVGLQELKLQEELFPHAEFQARGYQAVVHASKAWNGVSILSREPAETLQSGLPGQEHLGTRLVSARVAGVTFITVYCPNGKHVGHDDFPRKLSWYDALLSYLEARHDVSESLVLCGDFNICPAPLDSWNEEELGGQIIHTDEERDRFRRLLDWGLVDLYRERFPRERKFSWWDYRGGAFHRNRGLRIDFLLSTRVLAQRLRQVEIDRGYRKKKEGMTASDHAPVIADLEAAVS